jgi:hypothetical protein
VDLDLISGIEDIAKQSQETFKLILTSPVPYELEFSYRSYKTSSN